RERVNTMAEDAGGALWIGTDTRGAWKLAPTGFTVFGERDGLPTSDEMMSVFPDREGGVYVVSRPNTLSHLSRGRFESVTPFGLTSRSWGWHFLDLLSRDGEWWIPGQLGLRRYPGVHSFVDLGRTPPVHVYTDADGISGHEIFLQFEDSRGDIWFTTLDGEDRLMRWERRTGRILRYRTPDRNVVMSYAEGRDGSLWFGFYGGGVARYRDGAFRVFA